MLDEAADPAGETADAGPRHNLPAATTGFIGREQAVADLIDGITGGEARLITILAPGGMGKTRLALETARRIVERYGAQFPDGVYFVSLAELDDPAHIVPSIVEALGMQFHGADDLQEQTPALPARPADIVDPR